MMENKWEKKIYLREIDLGVEIRIKEEKKYK